MGAGRPTEYRPEYAKKAFKLALLGQIDKEIAEFFDVSEQTLNAWKSKHPEFLESLNKGKTSADSEMAHSLYKRGKGYAYKEKTYESNGENMKLTKIVTKVEPPNVSAAFIFLKNRQSGKWRDRQEITHSISGPQEFNIGGQKLTF